MKRGVIFFFGFVFSWLLLLPTSGMGQELEKFYENGKYGYRDQAGQTVVPPKYDDAWSFSEGFAKVKLNGKDGFIDKSGTVVIPLQYDDARYFSEGLAEVKLNGKWGFVDKSGAVVIPLQYDNVGYFSEGLAGVKLNGKYGFIDKSGTVVIPLQYDYALGFSEGLAKVTLNDKWGYVDKSGTVVIPLQYDDAGFFTEGLARVRLNGKYGFIDKSGTVVVPLQYDGALSFSEGLARVKLNGKWGFLDKSGTEVIPLQYDDAWSFFKGLAKVELNDKRGFIDKSGAVVVPLKYDGVWSFCEGLAVVKLNDKSGYVDKSGAVVVPLQYDGALGFREGLAGVKLNGKWGFVDKSGAVVVPLQYDGAWSFCEGFAKVALNGKWGDVDKSGKWYDSREDYFPFYAKPRVEQAINEWQKKGAYEKSSAWQARVTEASRQAKIAELTKGAEVQFLARQQQKATLNLSLGAYDADNEVFLVTMNQRDSLLVPVPITDAASFEQSFASIAKNPRYVIANDRLTLAELTLTVPSGKSYKYNNQTSLDYAVAAVDYNFDPIEIDLNTDTNTAPKGKQTISTVNVSIGKSDVDTDIPTTTVSNNKTFAVIIANEHYQREAKVEFAQNDGKTFKTYCLKTLGMPEENIHFVADATLNNLRAEIDWLTQVARNFSGAAKIIFYYAGHGIPDVETEAAYLLPTDGYGSNVISGYKLSDLYKSLSSYPTQAAIVFLDACFSGAQRSGEMLASARGVAIKVKEEAPAGNMVVFAATQGDQTAYPYRDKGHGLFTYYLLQKLQQTKGNTTLGELATFLTTNVREKSIVTNRKSQIPSITPSAAIAEDWKTLKLK